MIISDKEFTEVYVSEYLNVKFPSVYSGLASALAKYDIELKHIPYRIKTKIGGELSIWCRDYMPVRTEEYDAVLFEYTPDYLQFKKYQGQIPNNFEATIDVESDAYDMRKNNAIKEGIVLDGGNIVRCEDYVIMTDKVFDENPNWKQKDLINRLEELLHAEIIFLPWDKREIYGHTDGILRYAGNKKVILSTYGFPDIDSNDKWMQNRIEKRLSPYFDILPLNFDGIDGPYACKYRWAYVNWLQLDKVIVMPSFKGALENAIAKTLVEKYLPEYKGKIEMVEATELVKTGGGFNCATWTL